MNLKALTLLALIFWMSQAVLAYPRSNFRQFMPRSNLALIESDEFFLGDPIDYQGVVAQDIADPYIQQDDDVCNDCWFCCIG
ncbi:unnamed protein product [Chironomus riparius]|uniref:Uncharacterized protein n=1 Tax=Chironomus riparius TaxID=315576 RepID=A0A9N9RHG6_9DIPT|nr:unnamed protein product [Chironomus riparius]